jgi:L-threonylcarbamoyladenylate synthase
MAEIGTDVHKAASVLKAGQNVAIPTETVYGLAGLISSETAIRRIFEIKNRPFTDPLIVHVASVDDVPPLVADFQELARKLFDAFSPGPLTILLPKSDMVPDLVTNSSPLVAIRIPAHPLCLQLLKEVGEPLAAPSANPFGGISPTKPSHVEKGLGRKIPYILDGGECGVGLESTIVKLEGENAIRVLRQGGIPEEDLMLFAALESDAAQAAVTVPGSMLSHYAPGKPLYLDETAPGGNLVWLRFQNELPGIPPERQRVLSPSGDAAEAARNLFDALHYLDSLEADGIAAEKLPAAGLGKAVNDRLFRASVKR